MHLHPNQLVTVYEALRTFPPFNKWKFPDSDNVEFKVSRNIKHIGLMQPFIRRTNTPPIIEISSRLIGTFSTLVFYMAHEMLHLKQWIDREDSANTVHNAEFKRWAGVICTEFGWDVKQFVY